MPQNVLFETDQDVLTPAGETELNKLYEKMLLIPDMKVSLEGHTDNTNTPEHNQGLSERRANSAMNYLIGKGIDSSRLSAVGKGAGAPVAPNDSPEGRQQNRRIEFRRQ